MILFVDDEERRMESYIEELRRSNFLVQYEKDVGKALDFFRINYNELELLILDVMMPIGDIFEDVDTNYGLITGIKFYDRVRQDSPNVPIVIFTNMVEDNIQEKIQNDEKVQILHKEEYLPLDFVKQVKDFIGK
jgi:CheY-like chemotaxis protein